MSKPIKKPENELIASLEAISESLDYSFELDEKIKEISNKTEKTAEDFVKLDYFIRLKTELELLGRRPNKISEKRLFELRGEEITNNTRNNNFSEEDIAKISYLSITDCSFRENSLDQLKSFLQSSTSVESVDLSGCDLTADQTLKVVQALSNNPNPKIKILNLSGNEIDENCANALLNLLKQNNSLEELTISGSDIDDNILGTIASCFDVPNPNKSLKKFNFPGGLFDEQLVEKIQSDLLRNITESSILLDSEESIDLQPISFDRDQEDSPIASKALEKIREFNRNRDEGDPLKTKFETIGNELSEKELKFSDLESENPETKKEATKLKFATSYLEESLEKFQNPTINIENQAAVQIQRVFRGHLVRKEIEAKKNNLAATEIQRVFRGFIGRAKAQEKRNIPSESNTSETDSKSDLDLAKVIKDTLHFYSTATPRLDISRGDFTKDKNEEIVFGAAEIKDLISLTSNKPELLLDSRFGGITFDFKDVAKEDLEGFFTKSHQASFRGCKIKNLDLGQFRGSARSEEISKSLASQKFSNCSFENIKHDTSEKFRFDSGKFDEASKKDINEKSLIPHPSITQHTINSLAGLRSKSSPSLVNRG